MKLPEGASIVLDWHGDDRIPWTTAGDLAALLAMVEPDSPVYVVMSERYGTFDRIQIEGEPRG